MNLAVYINSQYTLCHLQNSNSSLAVNTLHGIVFKTLEKPRSNGSMLWTNSCRGIDYKTFKSWCVSLNIVLKEVYNYLDS